MTTLADRPWVKYYGDVPADIAVPDQTMYEWLADTARREHDRTAVSFLGTRLTFIRLLHEIDRCAAAFEALGVKAGDSVMVSLPNIPNVVVVFYALNRIGARAVMTHPLSSSDELRHFIKETGARFAIGVDMFYDKLAPLLDGTGVERLVVARIPDYLGAIMKLGFKATKGRAIKRVPAGDSRIVAWADLMKDAPAPGAYARMIDPADGAVVLFSGGTTSLPKGIELSSHAFNALAGAMIAITHMHPGESVLAIMPAFHGFGLGLCIHTALVGGATSILVPEVGTKSYIDALVKQKPSYIAGVPTLFQSLLQIPEFAKVDVSQLRGAFSGGDTLLPELKHRFDAALAAQGAHVELEEGYGLTECVTGCALSPVGFYRTGSVGVPMPGMDACVVKPGTTDPLPPDTEGELCVQGETLMNGYINDPEATAETLRRHADGKIWLHTGDVVTMDPDGYIFFKGRIKRIIKVSGISVYPAQVEQLLESHPAVRTACVIGIPDAHQMSSVKAFIVPAAGVRPDDALAEELKAFAKARLLKWSAPRHIEFRDELPTTKVGKIAYTELEREEAAKASTVASAGRP